MDKIKITERIHNKTIDFTNFMYQELSSIRYVRKGLNKSNKGTNDTNKDTNDSNNRTNDTNNDTNDTNGDTNDTN